MILLQILPARVLPLAEISYWQGFALVTFWTVAGWAIYFAASAAAGPKNTKSSRAYFLVLRVLLIISTVLWFLGALTNSSQLVGLVVAFSFGCGVTAYFIPSAIAAARQHPNLPGVFAVNLFLGWTMLGFVAAVVWALHRPAVSPAVQDSGIEERLRTLTELKATGLITDEEFTERRSAVLSSLAPS